MAFELEHFEQQQVDSEYISYLVDQQSPAVQSEYSRLWNYFRNPLTATAGLANGVLNSHSRPYFQAQEAGLPARITGACSGRAGESMTDVRRKEVVIENDIAWRVQTMVDFLFGKAPSFRSLAADKQQAEAIEKILSALLDANGGVGFLQELALLGSIYGFVDVALRIPAGGLLAPLPSFTHTAAPAGAAESNEASSVAAAQDAAGWPGTSDNSPQAQPGKAVLPRAADLPRLRLQAAIDCAAHLQLEAIEATRILPVVEEYDYRRLKLWVQRFHAHPSRLADSRRPWFGLLGRGRSSRPASVEVIEIISPTWWQRYEDRQLTAEGPNSLARLPIVHIQNVALAGSYCGLSDVEPLIPLQDELNTRLSDRAQRVTYQSFKMYLGKGIDDFLERPVGPGQMWATQNLNASIEEFGNDSGSPSEDAHIEQVRSALDKVSGVTPLAAGLIKDNVGYLTSASALKVCLAGLLSRTNRKRLTYGAGLQQIAELALAWLDEAGVFRTRPQDRRIEIHWPNVLPSDESEQLRNAQAKAQLGLPLERILAELGYERSVGAQ